MGQFDDIHLIISVKDDGTFALRSFQKAHQQTTDQIKRGNKTIGGSFNDLNKILPSTANVFNRVMQSVTRYARLAVLAIVAATEEFARRSFNAAKEFEYAMAEVHTIIGRSNVDMAKMSDQVLDLSVAIGESAKTVAGGLYWAISSGIKAGEAMEFMGDASKIAVAGLTSIETAADALTTVLNAYGLGVEHTMRISDQMFETVRIGKIRFEDLARTIGYGVTMAALLGVSTSDLMAAFAALTRVGFEAHRAMTALRSIFQMIIKPSRDAAMVAAHYGIELSAGAIASMGLVGWLRELREKMVLSGLSIDEMNSAIARMFPNVRGLTGLMGLVGPAFKLFEESADDIAYSIGATNVAFEKMADTVEFQLKRLKSAIQRDMIRLGYEWLPEIKKLFTFLTENSGTYFGLIKEIATAVYGSIKQIADALGLLPSSIKNAGSSLGSVYDIAVDLALMFATLGNTISKIGYGATVIIEQFKFWGYTIQNVLTLVVMLGDTIVRLIQLIGVGLVQAFKVAYEAVQYGLLWAFEQLLKGVAKLISLADKIDVLGLIPSGTAEMVQEYAAGIEERRIGKGKKVEETFAAGGDVLLATAQEQWRQFTYSVSGGLEQMRGRYERFGQTLYDATMRMSDAEVRTKALTKSIIEAADAAKNLVPHKQVEQALQTAINMFENAFGRLEEAIKSKVKALLELEEKITGYKPYAKQYEEYAKKLPGFRELVSEADFITGQLTGAIKIENGVIEAAGKTWKDLGSIIAVTTGDVVQLYEVQKAHQQAWSASIESNVRDIEGMLPNVVAIGQAMEGVRQISEQVVAITKEQAAELLKKQQAEAHAKDIKRRDELVQQMVALEKAYVDSAKAYEGYLKAIGEGAIKMAEAGGFFTTEFNLLCNAFTLGGEKVRQVANSINEVAIDAANILAEINRALNAARVTPVAATVTEAAVETKQHGGLIHGQEGMGDVVPVYARPREFVMTTAAVDRFGPEFFESLNRLATPSGKGDRMTVEVVLAPSEDFVNQIIARGGDAIIGVLDTNVKRVRKVLKIK